MKALVGYTGFVGGNIRRAAGDELEGLYNSKNISEAYGTEPDLLIYAGLRAEKYLANNAPGKDLELIREAEANIEKIRPKKLVLISTIDVFKEPKGKDENSAVDVEGLHAYGLNRYILEQWVREHYPDALIIRLPGLFGKGIKKNFIYDYIHRIPFMLNGKKMDELTGAEPLLPAYYELKSNGFYQVKQLDEAALKELREMFGKLGFSALNFTDSRSRYQFYDLGRFWGDINTALNAGLSTWHPATEPISAGELYRFLCGDEFVNELSGKPADYDYRTAFPGIFGGSDGYIADKANVLAAIKQFVDEEM